MQGLPLRAMAELVGVSVRRLRLMIERGAPVASPGRRGRGGGALIDLYAFSEWRACHALRRNTFDVDRFADKVPHLIAAGITESLRRARTRDEKRLLISAWYEITNAVRDELAADELEPALFTRISDALTSI